MVKGDIRCMGLGMRDKEPGEAGVPQTKAFATKISAWQYHGSHCNEEPRVHEVCWGYLNTQGLKEGTTGESQ